MGLLFKLVKLTRAVRIFFGGYKAMEEKHKLFQMKDVLDSREIYRRLLSDCYQYNPLSRTFRIAARTIPGWAFAGQGSQVVKQGRDL